MKNILNSTKGVLTMMTLLILTIGGLRLVIEGVKGIDFFVESPRLFGISILIYLVCTTYTILTSDDI